MAKQKKRSTRSNGKPRAAKRSGKQTAKVVAKEMPIKRHVSPTQKSIFANHMVVRGEIQTFQLFFFDIQPPIVLDGDPPELKKESESLKYLDAHCVSRLTIPHHVMPQFINALKQNFEGHKDLVAAYAKLEASKQAKESK